MGDTVNGVTLRPETAVLVRSILDTERLNRLGVDMAETRKDFWNSSGADFILSSPRQAVHDAASVGHLMAIRRGHPANDCGQDTRKRHSRSVSRCGKNGAHFTQPLSPIKARSVEHHGCCLPSVSNSKLSRAVPQPCTSCQRSDLPERFHSHVLSADRSSPESGSNSGRGLGAHSRVAPNCREDDTKVNWSTKPAGRGLSNLAKLKKKFTWSRKVTSLATDSSLKDDSGIGSQQSSSDELSTHRSSGGFFTISLSPKAASRKSQSRRVSDQHSAASPPPVEHVTKAPSPEEKSGTRQQPFLLCYLCGRMFGTASLRIHQPQCLQRSLREKEEKAPPPTRRAPPVGQLRQESAASANSDALFYGNNAFSLFQKTLVPCPKCARTFAPHRLEAHRKVCKEVAPDQENREEGLLNGS